MNNIYLKWGLGLWSACTLFGSAHAEEFQPALSRELLLEKAVTLPSNSVTTKLIRVQFPSGYKTPVHTHDGPGPRYVLKGKLRVEDAGESRVYGPGDVFWETGAAMTVESVGGGDAEIVIFELAPPKSEGGS
ncbi:cupin domain-containing protein [Methylococcus sp. EFPC2]|uniref:cupin domain-containing protein n=1 Tax=Methylococcus sp. EFPC2 TaxID=2812648 RepID=UPI0019687C77|nr:cupin domain-containing protein [Methylococcus sp. EFPC2]QSA97470.1 cupin domain-containing protein [Methylococcus sp. EFPC2]